MIYSYDINKMSDKKFLLMFIYRLIAKKYISMSMYNRYYNIIRKNN